MPWGMSPDYRFNIFDPLGMTSLQMMYPGACQLPCSTFVPLLPILLPPHVHRCKFLPSMYLGKAYRGM